MEAVLNHRIKAHKTNNLYRRRHVLSEKNELMVFCSNDYLGLAKHPALIKALQMGALRYGVGGVSSQIVVGHRDVHRDVENAFADFLGFEAALLFSCGYMANLGVINALMGKNDLIIADKFVHASLIDAAQLSLAQLQRFVHKNYLQLENILQKNQRKKRLIITDSVFSMSGELADINYCVDLADQYKAQLLVDDAHGIGVLGVAGSGCVELVDVKKTIVVCPLAKAFGVQGALVLGSKALIDYLIQFARSYIYTTALPPAMAYAALTSLQLAQKENWRREKLRDLILFFRKKAEALDLRLTDSKTPIQSIIIGDPGRAFEMSENLLKSGFLLKAMRPPTVPTHLSCLRVTLTCLHEKEQITKLLYKIRQIDDDLS